MPCALRLRVDEVRGGFISFEIGEILIASLVSKS